MNVILSLVAVAAIFVLGFLAGPAAGSVFGIWIPYAAFAVFLAGLAYRVFRWASTPVPFKITTTCGQQKTLPWIKRAKIESPASGLAVIGRMALEVFLFRSLFRNTKAELRDGFRFVYGEEKLLWAAAIAFHYSFLMIFLRHLRFFLEPVPWCVNVLGTLDGFLQIGAPILYASDVVIVFALLFLLGRRLYDPALRYISLFADYFALFLLLGIVGSGICMRYFSKVDIVAIKEAAMGWVTFSPVVPEGVGALFFTHVLFLSVLAAYFPFSKLMHMPGVFLSPTRNMANDNRMNRHVNPWNYPVKVHTLAEWEEEFEEKIKAAGLPFNTREVDNG